MPTLKYPRIAGPYPHRGGWRCKVYSRAGVFTWTRACEEESEAKGAAEGLVRAFQHQVSLAIGGLIEQYLAWLRANDRKPLTLAAARGHLLKLLGPLSHLEAASITPHRARARYMELATEVVEPPKIDERALVRRAVKRIAAEERRWLQQLIERPARGVRLISTEDGRRGREELLETFERRAATGYLDRRKTDPVYLSALWDKAEALFRKLRTAAEERRTRKKTVAAATHHEALRRSRTLWKWAQRQGLVRSNPWLEVDKVGRAKKGKPQLRIDEARKLADACMADVMVSDGALAVLIGQMMALRSSEVIFRVVRDADDRDEQDRPRLLWIPDTKTPAGKRALEIPGALRDAIAARVQGQPPDAPLLRASGGIVPSRAWFRRHLLHYCERAGVPPICPHALRGQWATIAVESGALTHAVAEALGHASFETTATHYAKPEAIDTARQRKRLGVLTGDKK